MTSRSLNRLDARLLRLQRHSRPWAIAVTAGMTDTFPQSAVVAAVSRVAGGDPGWTARLVGDDPQRLEWLSDGGRLPTVHAGPVQDLLDRRFELRNEGPLRISMEDRGDGSAVGLAVNHAFADGRGAVLLLRNLVAALAGQPSSPAPAVRDDELDLLPRRGVRQRARVAAALLRQSVRRVASLDIDELKSTSMASATLDMTAIVALRSTDPSLSVNDVLVAGVHRALRSTVSGARPVAVAVPVDLRRHIGGADSLGNAVLSAMTISADDEVPGLSAESSRHGAVIRDQTTAAWLGAQLAVSTTLTRPGESPANTRFRRPGWPQTAVCSNLGVIEDHPGWAGVRRIEFAPPAHEIATVGVATMGSMPTITVRMRSSLADTRALLGRIVEQLT